MNRLLAIEQYGLGDAVLSVPVLEALRRRWPQAELATLAGGGALALRQAFPCSFRVLSAPPQAEPWDAVLDLTGKLRTARLARRLAAAVVVGTPWWALRWGAGRCYTRVVSPEPGRHAVEHRLAMLAALGIEVGSAPPRLAASGEDREWAREWLEAHRLPGPLVALHPGGRSRGRSWGAPAYGELVGRLAPEGMVCLLVGEGRERAMLEGIASRMPGQALVAADLPLGRLAALLEQCRGFVGGDSGPLHLACALGVPVVALFGRSDPAWCGPYSDLARVITLGWPCSPCRRWPHERWRPCLRRYGCVRRIPVERVAEALLQAVSPGVCLA